MASNAEKNSEEGKRERKIPVFTVIKNGAILKNIFVINNPPSPSSEPSIYEQESAEEVLVVGRHPNCNIMLMHPSISRFHLRINSKPYSQKLFVTDLSSVHGTWVAEKKIEPGITVELNEGDTIRLGGSSRIYKLHWVPLSRAYDTENPFVSEADLEMLREKEEENAVLEGDASQMTKYQDMNSLSDGNEETQSDSILEAKGFSFVDENCGPIVELGIPSAHSVSEDINSSFVSEEVENPTTNDHNAREIPSLGPDNLQTKNQQFDEYSLSLENLAVNGEAETEITKVEPESNVSDDLILSVPTVPKNINPFLATEEIETLSINDHDVRRVSSSRTDICGTFETKNLQFNENDLSSEFHSAREAAETENRENPLITVRPDPNASDDLDSLLSFPGGPSDINYQQVEEIQTSEALAALRSVYDGNLDTFTYVPVSHESVDLTATEICGESAETGNIQNSMEKVEPESNVLDDLDCSVSSLGYLSNIKNLQFQENQTSEALAALKPVHDKGNLENFTNASVSDKSDVLAATEICGEVVEHSPESLVAFMPVCTDGEMENFMQPADPMATEICREVTDQSLSKNCCEGKELANVHYMPLAAEPLNSFSPIREVLSEVIGSKESQTPHSVIDEVENRKNMKSSVITSQKKLGLCNIWSRRGKPDAPLQLLTSRSNRKISGTASDDDVEWENQEEVEGGLCAKDIFSGLEGAEEVFTPGKENYTPNAVLLKSLKRNYKLSSSKIIFSPNINSGECTVASSDKENHTPKNLQRSKLARTTSTNQVKLEQDMVLNERRAERIPLQSLYVNLSGMRISDNLALNDVTSSSNSVNSAETVQKKITSFEDGRRRWVMVADTTTLLDKDSRKSLQLLQGLNRTRLVIPEMVIRELDCLKSRGSLFRRKTEASMALEWIEECMVKTKWWVHVESSVKDGRPITPTPRGSPQSRFCRGCEGIAQWKSLLRSCSCRNLMEIETPTAEDHILESGLYYRRMTNDEQLVLLSNDVTLTIKAMAEGLLCETAQDFRKSLLNPFSERFMWADSSPRGQTWSVFDDLVLKENFYRSPSMKSSNAKGLKLILLHNSHYGQQISRKPDC